ncbi:hypothetical protein QTP70_021822 [Hemibagrus guttatus]|uniref:Uncharacterized protein n=1 Tax=Hemibagrus guttatus TaxID=175788 RepID=A0AAE0PSY3_9TELE|nr:hypothetical protein QTP70_021822 [Hemibagrus guttatus]
MKMTTMMMATMMTMTTIMMTMKNRVIHSLSTAYPIYSRVTGSLCLSQASLGIKAGYTLDGVPTHRRAHTLSFTHAITHYGQFRDANQPTMHVFGLGEETGVPGGNPGEHANSTHTAETGIEPPTLEV